jgi:hypothetical protein
MGLFKQSGPLSADERMVVNQTSGPGAESFHDTASGMSPFSVAPYRACCICRSSQRRLQASRSFLERRSLGVRGRVQR